MKVDETSNRTDQVKKSVFKGNTVFWVAGLIIVVISLWGILWNDFFNDVSNAIMEWLKSRFSWGYLFGVFFFVVFNLFMAFGPYGKVKLGAPDDKPEYSTAAWFAMLFSAGMGVGMVFWGISEPLSHYVNPMAGYEPMTTEAMRFSIRSSIMNWGLHPWACYCVVALGMGVFQHHFHEKALVSNLFKPMLKGKTNGIIGQIIDVLTVVIIVTGTATALGMGCLQICGGLNYLFDIPDNIKTWLVLIAIIVILYMASAISGINKGIRILSNLNMTIVFAVMILAFLVGPTIDTIRNLCVGVFDYAVNFIPDSLRMSSHGDSTWIRNWRVFYWAWWLAWSPFVGVFVSRISKGRTIRQFVIGVMAIPTILSALWFSIFGTMAIHATSSYSAEKLNEIIASPQTALFYIFDKYPLGQILSVIIMVLLVTFFVTSADSATYTLAMLTSRGDLNPPLWKKAFWGLTFALMALALILSGSVSTIQTVSIVINTPYLFIMILICFNIILALKKEKKTGTDPKQTGD